MRIKIWCQGNADTRGFTVREVDWPVVPAKDSYINVFDGWAAERILDIFHNFDDGAVTLEIPFDRTGEYRAEVARRFAEVAP